MRVKFKLPYIGFRYEDNVDESKFRELIELTSFFVEIPWPLQPFASIDLYEFIQRDLLDEIWEYYEKYTELNFDNFSFILTPTGNGSYYESISFKKDELGFYYEVELYPFDI